MRILSNNTIPSSSPLPSVDQVLFVQSPDTLNPLHHQHQSQSQPHPQLGNTLYYADHPLQAATSALLAATNGDPHDIYANTTTGKLSWRFVIIVL